MPSTSTDHPLSLLSPGLPLVWMALLWVPTFVTAGPLESLMMPGKVIAGHAEWEKQCDRCHLKFKRDSQIQLCLDCHEKVAADMDSGSGYHGRSQEVARRECRECHTDHKGREADIVLLDPQLFDHRQTDFRLEGAHARARCSGCHESAARFREAPHECIGCHRTDDSHRGELGEKCSDCHDDRTWKRNRFDHEETGFPLTGGHRQVLCASCHPAQRYRDLPRECVGCHGVDDRHDGRFGRRCDECHATGEWKKVRFDHDRDTEFRLSGNHRKATCEGCHGNRPVFEEKLDKRCVACHRKEDEHRGANGDECQECHSPTRWGENRFDHDESDFPLRGAHEKLRCNECHLPGSEKPGLEGRCYACHALDDIHRRKQGERCDRCHDERSWIERVRFDHDVTHFPLIGIHAVTPCEACHVENRFEGTAGDCWSCHRDDDAHGESLGRACQACHNPNDWRLWGFDHDRQTEFPLEGAHRPLACDRCHRNGEPAEETSAECLFCHARDDAHDGRFGSRCSQCHGTETFGTFQMGGSRP